MTDTPTTPSWSTTPLAQPSRLRGMGRLRTRVRRAVLSRRRPLAALLAATAVAAATQVLAPPLPDTASVLVATHDLVAGAPVSAGDVVTQEWPADTVPEGAATPEDVVGRVLAAPLRSGEPVTDVRVGGPGFAATAPGLTALPVRIPDAGVVALLAPGDRIDLIATDPAEGTAETVAVDVLVLAVPAADGDGGLTAASGGAAGGLRGRLVVLAVSNATTEEVSAATVSRFLTVAFSR